MQRDPDCIFCKIVAGEIPCEKLFEDDRSLAFLDIGPLAEGHALVIPKDHYERLAEIPPEVAAEIGSHLPRLAEAVADAAGCAGYNLLQNNGKVAHQEVPHAHFHIIPRNAGDDFRFNWPAGQYPQGRMNELGRKIRDALSD